MYDKSKLVVLRKEMWLCVQLCWVVDLLAWMNELGGFCDFKWSLFSVLLMDDSWDTVVDAKYGFISLVLEKARQR